MTLAYQEFFSYSPLTDARMARISMFNGHGHEFFRMIPAGHGKRYREARLAAVEMIAEAMNSRDAQPGEVVP